MSVKARMKSGVLRAVRSLPEPRDEAALRTLRSARDLVTGRETPAPVAPAAPAPRRKKRARARYGTVPGPKLPRVERYPEDGEWLQPPVSEKKGLTSQLYPRDSDIRKRFDLELFEQLNEEYRDKPLVPAPRKWTSEALGNAARRRVLWAHHAIDLREKKVLEIGCGNGYEVWSMAHNLGADAYGVDVIQPACWEDLRDDRVDLRCVDLSVENPFPEDTFDRVVSYTVWEHVAHPHKLLEETYKMMKPGGLQFLRANLWAGPKASHRYRDIYFPWPHLLFSDDVIAEWDVKNGRAPRGSSWVNKLTWNHYERYIHDIGFNLRQVSFDGASFDEEFYQRFEDVLGRIPRWDLGKDFFTAILEKPA